MSVCGVDVTTYSRVCPSLCSQPSWLAPLPFPAVYDAAPRFSNCPCKRKVFFSSFQDRGEFCTSLNSGNLDLADMVVAIRSQRHAWVRELDRFYWTSGPQGSKRPMAILADHNVLGTEGNIVCKTVCYRFAFREGVFFFSILSFVRMVRKRTWSPVLVSPASNGGNKVP